MDYIGIDIGSTAAKIAILGDHEQFFVLPTGWSSIETVRSIQEKLINAGISFSESTVISTGYGRASVDFADKQVTEITCHAAGCAALCQECTVIDVGGQDTKVIDIKNGAVDDFLMNDKCSAGTGKFIEVMANRLAVSIDELFDMAENGQPVAISSLCTVFAESEVINHIGSGQKREDIAAGVVDSVAAKVSQLARRLPLAKKIYLTGGLSHLPYFTQCLSDKFDRKVESMPNGRYAGALGAAYIARRKFAK